LKDEGLYSHSAATLPQRHKEEKQITCLIDSIGNQLALHDGLQGTCGDDGRAGLLELLKQDSGQCLK